MWDEYRQMNLARVILLNLLIMYPFLELTRLIVWYSETYAFISFFILELAVFWSCWILFNIYLVRLLPKIAEN